MPYTGCKPGGGAKLKIGGKVGKQLVRAVSRNPKLTAKDLHWQALTGGVDCSVYTVQRLLTAAGLCSKRPVPKPLLLPHHIQARLAFARDVVDQDWSQFLFSDEATFWLESCVRRVWDRKGMKFVSRKINYPRNCKFWAVCLLQGLDLSIFQGIMNAEHLCQVYQKPLLPSAKKLFGPSSTEWILQEVNDSNHCSALALAWKAEHHVTTLPWPSSSPDLNPL